MQAFLNHLFPTGLALMLFLQLLLHFSCGSLIIFVCAVIFGGFIAASDIMVSDNFQLARLRVAVRQLQITKYLEEDLIKHLSPPARNYAKRRLGKAWRVKKLLLIHLDDDRVMDAARAFGFTRFLPICLHSLGSLEVSGRRPNMIHHHEFGHLFLFQPRGGIVSFVLGTAIPLICLVMLSEERSSLLYFLLMIGFLLQTVALFLIGDVKGEMQSDAFALACEFTKAWEEMQPDEQAKALNRGTLFEKRPPVIQAYARLLDQQDHSEGDPKKRSLIAALSSWLRSGSFERAYNRLNRLGWLNRMYSKFERETGGRDLYWREVFFRRVLQSLFLAPQTLLHAAGFAVYVTVFLSVGPVILGDGLVIVLISTAFAALAVIALSSAVLDDASSMRAQGVMRAFTSYNVVEEGVSENRRRKESEEALARWYAGGGLIDDMPEAAPLVAKSLTEHLVERWLFGKNDLGRD